MKQHNLPQRILISCSLLGALLGVTILVGTAFGAAELSPGTVFGVILDRMIELFGGHSKADPSASMIVLEVRLPRVILAALVGMALSQAGVGLQGLLMNPLADPYVIGVSSGAAVGAALALTFGFGGIAFGFGVPLMAFLAALVAMAIVYMLARSGGRIPVQTFLLAGIVVGSFMWALVTFLMFATQGPDEGLQRVVTWVMGSFAEADWVKIGLILPFVLGGGLGLFTMARELNVFVFGEDTARHLGIEPEGLKRWIIAFAALMTAAAVSVSGIIGFVGLVVPHMARRIVGPDHRILLPAAALLGGALMIIADTIARTIVAPAELPVGVITAILGAPFFCYLLRRNTKPS
jgi:iron complex transport system permease protein